MRLPVCNMSVRSSYLGDAAKFLSSLTLAAVASTVTIVILAQMEAIVSPPSQWVWDEFPIGLFAAFGVIAWIMGSLPAAIAFHLRIGIASYSLVGFGYSVLVLFLLQMLTGDFEYADAWKFSLALGVSGMAGGAVFALVADALDQA